MRSNVLKTDLDKSLPSIQEIQAALVKLRQTCVIGEQSHSLHSRSASLFTLTVYLPEKEFEYKGDFNV